MSKTRKKAVAVGKKTRKPRISDEMRQCITLMATQGLDLYDAAGKAGITRDSAVRNMHKPHILRLLNQMIKDVRDNAAQQAYIRNNHLAKTADNQRLRFDANRWVAGVDGISPVQKVQGQHQLTHSFKGFEYPTLDPIDVTPADMQSDADGEE